MDERLYTTFDQNQNNITRIILMVGKQLRIKYALNPR